MCMLVFVHAYICTHTCIWCVCWGGGPTRVIARPPPSSMPFLGLGSNRQAPPVKLLTLSLFDASVKSSHLPLPRSLCTFSLFDPADNYPPLANRHPCVLSKKLRKKELEFRILSHDHFLLVLRQPFAQQISQWIISSLGT